MRKFTRIRGGYRANNMSGARSAGLSRMSNPIFRSAYKTLGPKLGNLAYSGYKAAKARGYTGKIDPFVDFLLNNPQILGAFKNAGATILNSGAALPGMGVLPSPRSAGITTITHPGTGITLTRYYCKAPKLPNYVLRTGQKYIYNVLTPTSCFKLSNVGSPTLNGVIEYPTFNVDTLVALRNYLYDGTGTTTADSGWLSQRQGDYSGRMFVANCRSEVVITSSTNINCMLRIYELLCKETSSQTTRMYPLVSWQSGIDNALGTNTSTDFRAIGIFPGHSQTFRDYWHVDKIYDVKLSAGTTHKHVSQYNVNAEIPFSRFGELAGPTALAGLTRYYMFVLTPTPVHDQTNEDNVSLGTVSCDIVIKQTFEYYGITGGRRVINVASSTDTVTTPEVIADTDFVETGIVS